jgi:prepilin-type processing-associated H-X9-DG protein
VPNQHLTSASDPNTAASSVLVCPSVRTSRVYDNLTSQSLGTTPNTDGFDRRMSKCIQPGLIVDSAYGINGDVYSSPGAAVDPQPNPGYDDSEVSPATQNANYGVPCRAISTNYSHEPCGPSHKYVNFKWSALTVLLYDGSEWNGMILGAEWRISGARHGAYNANPAANMLITNNGNTINITGTTNLLFMDGHVENAARSQCPYLDNQWVGYRNEMVPNTEYIWNLKQQN